MTLVTQTQDPILIAAKLLDALQNLAGLYADMLDDMADTVDDSHPYAKAREAIALATGETLPEFNKPLVIIEVSGGIAEVTSKPDHIDVDIIDHDNLEVASNA